MGSRRGTVTDWDKFTEQGDIDSDSDGSFVIVGVENPQVAGQLDVLFQNGSAPNVPVRVTFDPLVSDGTHAVNVMITSGGVAAPIFGMARMAAQASSHANIASGHAQALSDLQGAPAESIAAAHVSAAAAHASAAASHAAAATAAASNLPGPAGGSGKKKK